MTAWHKNVNGQTSHGYPPQGNQAGLLSMRKIKMLTKANFRVPTRLLETLQSCGHNPLLTAIAVTDTRFPWGQKIQSHDDRRQGNRQQRPFSFLLGASWFWSFRLFAFFLALKSVTDVAFFTKAMIRARNVGAQRVGVAVMSIAKTLVEIWKEKRKKAIKKKDRKRKHSTFWEHCFPSPWLATASRRANHSGYSIADTQNRLRRRY